MGMRACQLSFWGSRGVCRDQQYDLFCTAPEAACGSGRTALQHRAASTPAQQHQPPAAAARQHGAAQAQQQGQCPSSHGSMAEEIVQWTQNDGCSTVKCERAG